VAVKILHAGLSGDPVFQRRFHVEARAVAALQAPGIVNVYDFGEETGDAGPVSFLIMEFVAGRSLQDILSERGSLSAQRTMRLLAEAASSLQVAHSAGIIHRDIKPANILITERDGASKLVDFGIARAQGEAGLTSTGMVMGTAAYLAPELLHGQHPTGSSDIYSLGVVGYECLSGRKPFGGDTPASIIAAHLTHEPAPMPPHVPADVGRVVMRALAKDPANRWASAAEFAAACRAPGTAANAAATTTVVPMSGQTAPLRQPFAAGTARPSRPPQPPRSEFPPPRQAQRKEKPIALIVGLIAGLVVLAMLGLLIWQPWNAGTPTPDDSSSAGKTSAHKSTDEGTDEVTDEVTTPEQTTPEEPSSASESSSSPEPTSAPLPDVTGQSESNAVGMLNEAGFSNVTAQYRGSGDERCGVDSQEPGANEETEFSAAVTLHIEQVDDVDDCEVPPSG
jgi:serine/threonine protein kinase